MLSRRQDRTASTGIKVQRRKYSAWWPAFARYPLLLLERAPILRAVLVLFLLALPAFSVFLTYGSPETADGKLHVLRVALLDGQLRDGWLLPRWLPDLVFGHGYPIFNFYGPGSYYLAELLHLAGLGFEAAVLVTSCVLILLAGTGMYLFARELFGTRQQLPALVAGTAYMYAPYFLSNIYMRGALPEATAQMLLPWVFWPLVRMMASRDPLRYAVPVALPLAAVALAHNLTLLFVAPIWLALAALLWLQYGRSRAAAGAVVASGAVALGITAFFWLPVLAEYGYLTDRTYATVAGALGGHLWTLANFLDRGFRFSYSFTPPYRLGLVQLILALLGILLARRKDHAWLFLICVAIAASAAITTPAGPLWLGNRILLSAQFPWRLLSIVSLPLAVLTGGIIAGTKRTRLRIAGTLLLLAVIVSANWPSVDWGLASSAGVGVGGVPLSRAAAAQVEAETGAIGTTTYGEYLPRWVAAPVLTAPPDGMPGPDSIEVRSANSLELVASVRSTAPSTLRMSTFYYPAWRVFLGNGEELRSYPSSELGLLTMDLPAGNSELHVRWAGTTASRAGGLVTLATLAAVACGYLLSRRRLRALPFVVTLLLGAFGYFYSPPLHPVSQPAQAVAGNATVRLAGYQWELEDSAYLVVEPFWLVHSQPSPSFEVRWALRPVGGGPIVAGRTGTPRFGAEQAGNWPPGILIRDAYRISLPPGMPAGEYELSMTAGDGPLPAETPPHEMREIGRITLPAVPEQAAPPSADTARFEESVRLEGISLNRNGRAVPDSEERAVVRVGDRLEYVVYWRALQDLDTNYHGFLHLLDGEGRPVAQRDQIAGGSWSPSKLWSPVRLEADVYRLELPEQLASGVYTPIVGLYRRESGVRLPVFDASGESIGDHFRLPQIKVVGQPTGRPEQAATARIGDMADFRGFTLRPASRRVKPGQEIEVTLYYRSRGTGHGEYSRFLHLYDPTLGMAGQQDGIPGRAGNPTSSWVAGEEVEDSVTLKVSPGAKPGRYVLSAGFYNPRRKPGGCRWWTGRGKCSPMAG